MDFRKTYISRCWVDRGSTRPRFCGPILIKTARCHVVVPSDVAKLSMQSKGGLMRIDAEAEACEKSPEKFGDAKILQGLLVAENVQSYSHFARRLQELGCECEFATSYQQACSRLATEDISLVLSTTRLHGKDLLPLVDLLGRSKVTLFYTHSVELGCWWLPALWRGHRCFGSYAIPPSQFVSALEELINEIRRDKETRRQGTAVASDWPLFTGRGGEPANQ